MRIQLIRSSLILSHHNQRVYGNYIFLLIDSLQVQPNTIVSGFFEEGGNCTLVGDDSLDAKGFAMLDLTSLVIYDDVLLTFMVDDFHGNGSILFSSQVVHDFIFLLDTPRVIL